MGKKSKPELIEVSLSLLLTPVMDEAEWAFTDNVVTQHDPGHAQEYLERNESLTELRDRFLNIERGNTKALFQFLTDTGAWEETKKEVLRIPVDSFWDDQQSMRELMRKRRSEELLQLAEDRINSAVESVADTGGLRFTLWRDRPPTLFLTARATRSLLYLSIWLEIIREFKFRYCSRHDCPTHRAGTAPFRVSSGHDRLYCSRECANIESVRRFRREKSQEGGR